MFILIIIALVVWFLTDFFFKKVHRAKSLSKLSTIILQMLSTWSVYSIPLLLLYTYSENLPPNYGYITYPLLVTALAGSIGGPLLTLIIANRKN